MKAISNETQKLAALAVFGTLFDAKKDIYSVLHEFIKQIFVIKGMHSSFSMEELRDELNNLFGFDNIPLSVVKTSVNQMPELHTDDDTSVISVVDNNDDNKFHQTISNELQKAEEESGNIIERLFTFYEKHNNGTITDNDKVQLQHALYFYLLKEEYHSQYVELINLFILEHEKDTTLIAQLQQIVAGVLIQSAFRYQSHPNQIDKFTNTLYIYLDTEIIFFLAGYNGPMYQTLAKEFLGQVSNMNSETKKVHKEDKIKLRFFEEVDQEITDFFNLAIKIINGEVPLDRKKTAMNNILDGCQSASDIIAKKSDLNILLKQNNIQIDSKINYYEEDKHQYNIENKAFYENVTDPSEIKKIDSALSLLSHVNVRRGNRSQKVFNNVGCILLTGDATTINISLDEKVLEKGNVPLATSMSYLTNRFWFTTNQSFSNNPNIQSFQIATRARIALSAEISQKIQLQFRKLQVEHKNGTLTDEAIAERISELHQYPLTPDNLDDKQESIKEYYDFLRIGDLGQVLESRAIEKKKSDALIAEQTNTIQEQTNTITQQTNTIEEQLTTIHQQERTIEEQNKLIDEQNTELDTQARKINDNEEEIKKKGQIISSQDKRIRDLEERPKRILLHILLFIRFLILWAIMIASAVLLICTAVDMYNHYNEDSLYSIVSASCSILGWIAALICIPVIKKTRGWLSYKSFNRQAVEVIISKKRKNDNNN